MEWIAAAPQQSPDGIHLMVSPSGGLLDVDAFSDLAGEGRLKEVRG
jgi:hypothetical protein